MTNCKRRNPFEDMPASKLHCKFSTPNTYHDNDIIMINKAFERELEKVLEMKFLHYIDQFFCDDSSEYDSD